MARLCVRTQYLELLLDCMVLPCSVEVENELALPRHTPGAKGKLQVWRKVGSHGQWGMLISSN